MANNEIDLGLTVLCALAEAGETLTFKEIADVCGCSTQMIQRIQKQALNKLQHSQLLAEFIEQPPANSVTPKGLAQFNQPEYLLWSN